LIVSAYENHTTKDTKGNISWELFKNAIKSAIKDSATTSPNFSLHKDRDENHYTIRNLDQLSDLVVIASNHSFVSCFTIEKQL